ncbi:MAG: hypothetical protein ACOY3P_10600 [Planctomycetota bacterium]
MIARKGPALSVETIGPRKITVGRESSYELTLTNSGEVPADEVVVFVNLPAWADVLGAEASVGSTQLGSPADAVKPFLWKVGQLAAMGRERLTLRIVPRESKPFDLGVRWDYRPMASQAMIEVQEPKLTMALEGPREVFYGKKEIFTLKLANVGNGDAEEVMITLEPIGSGDNQPASHRLGLVRAGEQKSIEVELTARQTGELVIQVGARGEGNVQASVSEKVLVRRAALQLSAVGPQMQFVGATATFRVHIANPGNAAAQNLKVSLSLPPGAKYLSGIDGAQAETNGTRISWIVDRLAPGESRDFDARCNLGLAGLNRLDVACSGDDELAATAAVSTRVEAVADLILEVRDPVGPVAAGTDTVYELRLHNRGTKAAEGVEVLAVFSEGIEPVGVEGALHRIQPGQVVFNPIPSIGPGAELLLKVRARAGAAGMHVFRCEVHCKPLGIRRISEVTTHFYEDTLASPAPAGRPSRLPPSTDTAPPMVHAAESGAVAPPGAFTPNGMIPSRAADRRESYGPAPPVYVPIPGGIAR